MVHPRMGQYVRIGATNSIVRDTIVYERTRYERISRRMYRKEMAMMIAEKIYAAFDEVSQRNTRPRRLIAERLVELADSETDFTTDELWQELRKLEPRLGRATVFRSIEKLVAIGVLERVEFADGTHHYRVCGGAHHHHLTCTKCHRVVDINVCLPKEQLAAIERQTDFAIEGHSLSLFGLCKACRC